MTTDTVMTAPSTELVVRHDIDLDKFARLGKWLAASESGQQTPDALGAAAALRLFYAHELSLPPLAVAELSVIKGRLVVGAKLLRALAARHGYRVRRVDSTPDSCTAVLEDASTGQEIARTTYTFEQAKTAGLVRDRSAWTTHPDRMLWARASKYVLDDNAPEVTLGLLTDDEANEITSQPAHTAQHAIEAEAEDVTETFDSGELPLTEDEANLQPPVSTDTVSPLDLLIATYGREPVAQAYRELLHRELLPGRGNAQLTGEEVEVLSDRLTSETV